MINKLLSVRKQTIHFHDNGYYKIEREILFKPPEIQKMLFTFIIQYCFAEQTAKGISLSEQHKDLENLPSTFMICYLNGFEEAKQS
jgi:hypothetical protein